MAAETQPDEGPVDLSALDSFLQATGQLAEELLRAANSLPEVSEDGGSECPFAEELYADKEEKQRELEGRFQQLHVYKQAVEELISKCDNDLVVVASHQDRIHGDKAREHYSQAEVELAAKRRQFLKTRLEIEEMIKKVDQALRESVSKRYPGKIPQKWPGIWSDSDVPPDDDVLHPIEQKNAEQELDDLFSLDRLRNADQPDRPDRPTDREEGRARNAS